MRTRRQNLIDETFENVFAILYERLRGTSINWALTGSFAFALQGMPLQPNDIDIQTDKRGAYAIEKLFAEFMVLPVRFRTSGNIRSHLGRMLIEGVSVEIMGDIEKVGEGGAWVGPVNLEQHKVYIDYKGKKVPVLSLEYERGAYLAMGRVERARQIEEWLGRRDKT